MGNANTNTLVDIWEGDKYRALRFEQLSLDLKDSICSNCDSWYPEIGRQGTGEAYEKN